MAAGVATVWIVVLSIALSASAAFMLRRLFVLRRSLREERLRGRALADAVREVAQASAEGEAAARGALFAAVARLLPARLLLYFQADGELLRCVDGWGPTAPAWRGVQLLRDGAGNVVTLAASTGCAQVLRTGGAVRPLIPEQRCAAALVIRHRDRLCGVLYAGGLPTAPTPEALELATLLSTACAGALEAGARIERHVTEAITDGLTGLLTPRAFRLRLARALAPAAHDRYAALALIFLDTDHFKRVNDRLGHAAGDALLRGVARVLRECCEGASALIARNGGDEFCLALLDEGKGPAVERAERIRRAVRALGSDVSASIGVAAYPEDAQSAELLLEAADGAMYHSKRSGKDRVSVAGPLGPAVASREEAEGS
ncbi:GGDEF domain-containing protein [bacterium]|nr:MAG: GGDEF domain-containing protein [bacterium]